MDYKDLANLIFPDAKPIEFYEEKYPERDLPEGAMVVRIGPSPTGCSYWNYIPSFACKNYCR